MNDILVWCGAAFPAILFSINKRIFAIDFNKFDGNVVFTIHMHTFFRSEIVVESCLFYLREMIFTKTDFSFQPKKTSGIDSYRAELMDKISLCAERMLLKCESVPNRMRAGILLNWNPLQKNELSICSAVLADIKFADGAIKIIFLVDGNC